MNKARSVLKMFKGDKVKAINELYKLQRLAGADTRTRTMLGFAIQALELGLVP